MGAVGKRIGAVGKRIGLFVTGVKKVKFGPIVALTSTGVSATGARAGAAAVANIEDATGKVTNAVFAAVRGNTFVAVAGAATETVPGVPFASVGLAFTGAAVVFPVLNGLAFAVVTGLSFTGSLSASTGRSSRPKEEEATKSEQLAPSKIAALRTFFIESRGGRCDFESGRHSLRKLCGNGGCEQW
jgi:hypothetical protein